MRTGRLFRLSAVLLAASASIWSLSSARSDDLADFKSALDGSPMKFELKPGEVETPVLKKFKATGINDYRGNEDAIAEGKRLYRANCIVCHGADGTGKMGPTLIGKDVIYKQILTDPGMFSVIYGGASGAMQSFSRRGMKQDQMLKIVAFVRTLEK